MDSDLNSNSNMSRDPVDSAWSLPDSDSDTMSWSYQQSILSDFPWTTTYDSPPQLAGHTTALDRQSSPLADVDDYQPSDAPPAPSSAVGGVSCSAAPTTSNASSSSSEDPGDKPATASAAAAAVTSTKAKKKAQKRVRQPRFAFMTKSEVDHLEDGYRWRKYGQKAVKNSPFPRSYYRCTNGKCTVKKRVERSCENPSIVITTYEGQHCHHTIGFPRSSGAFLGHEGAFLGQFSAQMSQRLLYQGMQFSQENPGNNNIIAQPSFSNASVQGPFAMAATTGVQDSSVSSMQPHEPPAMEVEGSSLAVSKPISHDQPPVEEGASPCTGEGLLGDIVPPGMRNP